MRRNSLVLIPVILLTLQLSVSAIAVTDTAAVALRTGETVRGDVQGMLVAGGVVEQKKGPETWYAGAYHLMRGNEIAGIDEQGIRCKPKSSVGLIVVIQREPLDVAKVLDMAAPWFEQDADFMTAMFAYKKAHPSASIDTKFSDEALPVAATLLGEYKRQEGRLVSAIQVVSGKGVVTVPVARIVEFRKK